MNKNTPRGRRGTRNNPPNRFEPLGLVLDETDGTGGQTLFYRDRTRTILARNQSPDIGFEYSINPYRGCEHGCVYCYARPTHEYLGLSAGLDFETQIFVKAEAPDLLYRELRSPKWKAQAIAISGVTDAFQPLEKKLQLTRRCLEVLAEFRNPVSVVTKNHLVTRDLDILHELASFEAAHVNISITTLNRQLQRSLEPRTSSPERRLQAVEKIATVGVPVGIIVAPVIPGLTEHEVPRILELGRRAGAQVARFQMLRLPGAVQDIFLDWLQRQFPLRKTRVLNRIREVRDGKLHDGRFHTRMSGEGLYADQVRQLFERSRRKMGLAEDFPPLSSASFRRWGQLRLPL